MKLVYTYLEVIFFRDKEKIFKYFLSAIPDFTCESAIGNYLESLSLSWFSLWKHLMKFKALMFFHGDQYPCFALETCRLQKH